MKHSKGPTMSAKRQPNKRVVIVPIPSESPLNPWPKWLLRAFAIFAWRTVKDTGAIVYQENAVTSNRRAIRTTAGHQPINVRWVTGQDGEWTDGPRNPPSGAPSKPA